MSLPLEDLFNDVVGKSMRGLGLSDADLAARSGVSATDIAAVKAGTVDDATLTKIAPHLGLHGPSLVTMAHEAWGPADIEIPGLAQFNTTYHDMTVNAYLVWDEETKNAIAFDTGADAQPILQRGHVFRGQPVRHAKLIRRGGEGPRLGRGHKGLEFIDEVHAPLRTFEG